MEVVPPLLVEALLACLLKVQHRVWWCFVWGWHSSHFIPAFNVDESWDSGTPVLSDQTLLSLFQAHALRYPSPIMRAGSLVVLDSI